MGVITQISAQVKRPDRYSIYVDGVYTFSLSEVDMLRLALHSGQQVTNEEIEQYRDISAYRKWYDRILNLLSYRMRSEWEVTAYLQRKECPDVYIEQICGKLRTLGYLNDEDFARSWVANRRALKPISRRKLAQELQQKRISRQIIDAVLRDDQHAVDEMETLRNLIAKKQTRYPDRNKFMQYLARQGYSYHDIRQALDEMGDD